MRDILLFAVFLMVDLLALFNIVLLVEIPFGIRMGNYAKRLGVMGVLFMIAQIIAETCLDLSDLASVLYQYSFMLVATVWFAKEKKIRAALLTVPAVFVYLQWVAIIELIEMLFGLHKLTFTVFEKELTPFFCVPEISLFIVLLLLKRYANKKAMKVSLTLGEGIFLTLYCVFSPILTEILMVLNSYFQNNTFNMAWITFILALDIMVIYAIAHRKTARYYKGLSENYRSQFDVEYTYFEEYKKNNKEMAHFRHDWNNHMIMMQSLLEDGKYEEAKEYFSALPGVGEKQRNKTATGNEAVDMVLSSKLPLFESAGIVFDFTGNLSRLKGMETVDICILFSNLVDNALEAARKCEKDRYYKIRVTESPNVLLITMENSMTGEIIKNGNVLHTTKIDAENHGIGMQNVSEIIKKYNGEYEIETTSGKFIVRIILPFGETIE